MRSTIAPARCRRPVASWSSRCSPSRCRRAARARRLRVEVRFGRRGRRRLEPGAPRIRDPLGLAARELVSRAGARCSCCRGSSRCSRRAARARAQRGRAPGRRRTGSAAAASSRARSSSSTRCGRTARARPRRASTGRPWRARGEMMERRLVADSDPRRWWCSTRRARERGGARQGRPRRRVADRAPGPRRAAARCCCRATGAPIEVGPTWLLAAAARAARAGRAGRRTAAAAALERAGAILWVTARTRRAAARAEAPAAPRRASWSRRRRCRGARARVRRGRLLRPSRSGAPAGRPGGRRRVSASAAASPPAPRARRVGRAHAAPLRLAPAPGSPSLHGLAAIGVRLLGLVRRRDRAAAAADRPARAHRRRRAVPVAPAAPWRGALGRPPGAAAAARRPDRARARAGAAGLPAELLRPGNWDDFAAARPGIRPRRSRWPYDGATRSSRLACCWRCRCSCSPPRCLLAGQAATRPRRGRARAARRPVYGVAITDQISASRAADCMLLAADRGVALAAEAPPRRRSPPPRWSRAGLFALPVAAALDPTSPGGDYADWRIGDGERRHLRLEPPLRADRLAALGQDAADGASPTSRTTGRPRRSTSSTACAGRTPGRRRQRRRRAAARAPGRQAAGLEDTRAGTAVPLHRALARATC